MKYKQLKRHALTHTCRCCINEQYQLQLTPADCLYWPYPSPCAVCGKVRNIVMDIHWLRRWKLWVQRKPQSAALH